MAEEIFSPHGKYRTLQGLFSGSSGMSSPTIEAHAGTGLTKGRGTEIAVSRRHSWDNVDDRRHEVSKIYANDAREGLDLLVLGSLFTVAEGKQKKVEFIARGVLTNAADASVRLTHWEVCAVAPQVSTYGVNP